MTERADELIVNTSRNRPNPSTFLSALWMMTSLALSHWLLAESLPAIAIETRLAPDARYPLLQWSPLVRDMDTLRSVVKPFFFGQDVDLTGGFHCILCAAGGDSKTSSPFDAQCVTGEDGTPDTGRKQEMSQNQPKFNPIVST